MLESRGITEVHVFLPLPLLSFFCRVTTISLSLWGGVGGWMWGLHEKRKKKKEKEKKKEKKKKKRKRVFFFFFFFFSRP